MILFHANPFEDLKIIMNTILIKIKIMIFNTIQVRVRRRRRAKGWPDTRGMETRYFDFHFVICRFPGKGHKSPQEKA